MESYNLLSTENLYGEIWKPVVGYDGVYEVSNIGRVKRLVGYHCWKDRVLRQNLVRGNYCMVILSVNDDKKPSPVHRIVAKAFIPNPLNKPFINHKDANPKNNCVDNLEWCTQSENIKHAVKLGRMKCNFPKYSKENHPSYGKPLSYKSKKQMSESKKVYSDEIISNILREYKSGVKQSELHRKYKISRSYLSQLVNNKKQRVR